MQKNGHYWKEFWDLVPASVDVIIGVDAHSVAELDRIRC